MLKKILGTIGSRYLIAFLNLALIFINAKVLGIEGVGMIGLIVASVNIAVIVNGILCGNTIVYFMNCYSMRTIFLPAYLCTPIGSSLACGFMYLTGLLPTGYRLILINQGLQHHGGDLAIGAFGIVNRLVFLFVMIVMGLNQGMQPIAGYNYGAKQYPRVTKVLKITIYAATIVTTTGFLMGMFIPRLAVSIFTTHEELVRISAKGLRIVVMFFPIVGFQMVTSNFFQSIGMASKAIFLSVSRQVLILIPCLLILPQFYGQLGVWISMPISDLIASLIAGTMLWWQFKQFRKVSV